MIDAGWCKVLHHSTDIFIIGILTDPTKTRIDKNLSADKFLSILVLVGSVNIPIIKMSVEWWSTLHQPASITLSEKPAIDMVMLYPLFGSIIGFTGLIACKQSTQ